MDSTQRFSKTVENYIRFRPAYPAALLSFIQEELGINAHSSIADIGSGTGKLTNLLLQNNGPVYAVEPNEPMRKAAEVALGKNKNFKSINGTAEATQLANNSVDLISVAQAFHWFDPAPTRKEFLRIAKKGTPVLLIWNKRKDDHAPFMKAYNDFLLAHSTDYEKVNLRRINDKIFRAFFGADGYQQVNFPYAQEFDWEGLKGRYLSCSYAFDQEHKKHEVAMEKLMILFEKYQEKETIDMVYQTEVYYGVL